MFKRGVSVISLVLCAVVITLTISALVIANNNSATFKANMESKENIDVLESSAYTDVYTADQVKQIAIDAYVNEYLDYYEGKMSIEELDALVRERMLDKVGENELAKYEIIVHENSIEVNKK